MRLFLAANDEEHAFYWNPGRGLLDLGTLGGTQSNAMQINDRRQVTGSAFGPENNYHAFLWSREKGMVDVGVAYDRNHLERGFVWTEKRGLMDLNTVVDPGLHVFMGRTAGNNNHGQIVAEGRTASGARTVFLLNLRDAQGPVLTCAPTQILSPPNHKLLPFSLANIVMRVVDASDGPLTVNESCRIVSF